MNKKSLNVIMSICLFLVFGIALVSAIVTASTTGIFLPADIVFLFGTLLGAIMYLWALRIPMHAKAAVYIANLCLVATSILFGTSYLTGTGLSAYYMSSGILNFIAAFFLFDALVFMTHHFLRVYNFKWISIALFCLGGVILIAIAIVRIACEAGKGVDLMMVLSTISLLTSAIVVPGLGVITLLSEGK